MANVGYPDQNKGLKDDKQTVASYVGFFFPVVFVGTLLVLILSQGKDIK